MENELQIEVKLLKQKLKDERKKNRLLRKENKRMLEKADKYQCCKHIDKRGFSLESPRRRGRTRVLSKLRQFKTSIFGRNYQH